MKSANLPSDNDYLKVLQLWQRVAESSPIESKLNHSFSDPAFLAMLDQSPCVSWIMDIRTQEYVFVSRNTLDHFGYSSDNYRSMGQSFQEKIRHPQDRPGTWKLIYKIWHVLNSVPPAHRANYRFSYDYRILKPDGQVIRVLEQNAILQQDKAGNITHLLGLCNDITRFKHSGSLLASLDSDVDNQHFLFNCDNTPNAKTILSKRELEIVKLLSEGQSSKAIADKLFISFHTVNTHRKKMIDKTNSKNTGGLVQFASFNGLI